tara:strand:+ start:225 stop:1094 length:870 start_codon:yes stop_codon:yes gene_type:complete
MSLNMENKKMKIGIIGQGYVGTAVKEVFKKYYDLLTYDINEKLSTTKNIEELTENVDLIFVCVPTPMNKDGSCNLSIINSVMSEINSSVNKKCNLVAVKSTIPPGTTKKLNLMFSDLDIVFNPEFLTEANFIEDFKNQNRIIIGSDKPVFKKIREVYSLVFPKSKIIETKSDIAEMVKYFTNIFLATKVSFANEMKMVCDKLKIDYTKVVEFATCDERLGKSHWSVPGPDGKLGFGGSCFPKDINAFVYLCKQIDMDVNVISSAIDTNLQVRPEKDWEKLKGRAVTEEE